MKFRVGRKQRLAAADAHVGSFGFLVFVFAREGRLSSLLARDVILIVIQFGTPFGVALAYFFAHGDSLHEVSISCEARRATQCGGWSDILGGQNQRLADNRARGVVLAQASR